MKRAWCAIFGHRWVLGGQTVTVWDWSLDEEIFCGRCGERFA